ncbi:MAG: flagellar hook-associated protein FlgL [Eubacteriales bacterium]
MRVTSNMLSQNLLSNLEMANNKMDLLQNKLASGQSITKPSDDPVKIETALRYKSTISSMEQWKINASEGLSFMETTEGILSDMTSMLQRVRELTIQGANGTNSISDRSQIANEVDQLTQQFHLTANSQIGSKYVFSGTNIDTEPLSDYPDDIPSPPPAPTEWNGNENRLEFEVGSNLSLPITIKGTDLFGITDNGDGTQSSAFFDTLNKLSTALRDGDTDKINESLGEIDDHIDNVLALRAELGARTNRMEVIYNQTDYSITNLQQNLSDIQDADMAETIMEFQSVQNVYRAALSVGSKIIQPSLVDFMS